jgi:hypothetical protein
MAGQLKPGTLRVSYVESKQTDTALDILATIKHTSKSALLREATSAYLSKEDKDHRIRKLAGRLASSLPDGANNRAKAELDPELQREVLKLLSRIRK